MILMTNPKCYTTFSLRTVMSPLLLSLVLILLPITINGAVTELSEPRMCIDFQNQRVTDVFTLHGTTRQSVASSGRFGGCSNNRCGDGCCRFHTHTLICDTTNLYRHQQCICNENTKTAAEWAAEQGQDERAEARPVDVDVDVTVVEEEEPNDIVTAPDLTPEEDPTNVDEPPVMDEDGINTVEVDAESETDTDTETETDTNIVEDTETTEESDTEPATDYYVHEPEYEISEPENCLPFESALVRAVIEHHSTLVDEDRERDDRDQQKKDNKKDKKEKNNKNKRYLRKNEDRINDDNETTQQRESLARESSVVSSLGLCAENKCDQGCCRWMEDTLICDTANRYAGFACVCNANTFPWYRDDLAPSVVDSKEPEPDVEEIPDENTPLVPDEDVPTEQDEQTPDDNTPIRPVDIPQREDDIPRETVDRPQVPDRNSDAANDECADTSNNFYHITYTALGKDFIPCSGASRCAPTDAGERTCCLKDFCWCGTFKGAEECI